MVKCRVCGKEVNILAMSLISVKVSGLRSFRTLSFWICKEKCLKAYNVLPANNMLAKVLQILNSEGKANSFWNEI